MSIKLALNNDSKPTGSKISDVEGFVLIFVRCFRERLRCMRQLKKKILSACSKSSEKVTSKKGERYICLCACHEGTLCGRIIASFILKLDT